MKFNCFLIAVILFQATFGVEDFGQKIFVNIYQSIEKPKEIGRLSNFGFSIESYEMKTSQNYLNLTSSGVITINSNIKTNETSMFKVELKRYEDNGFIISTVYLTVTIITNEIIENSASVIVKGVTSANFIDGSKELSKCEKLISFLNRKLNKKYCDVSSNISTQIFSIEYDQNPKILDVRFAVRSVSAGQNRTTYGHQDKLHWILLENQEEIEKLLKIKIERIGNDPCLIKERHCASCRIKVRRVHELTTISTYKTLFIATKIEHNQENVTVQWMK